MKVNYIGPLMIGLSHPALAGFSRDYFPPSTFAVEVCDEAGCDGPLMEGDVLIVDDKKLPHHDDLVIVDIDDHYELMRAFRCGNALRLISMLGGEGLFATTDILRGVVTRQIRRYL